MSDDKPAALPAEVLARWRAAERGRTPPGDLPAGEVGGPGGPEPTRYGDWERDGRCVDF
ncbi:MAG: DUF1674 domain-containing protein [Alphaproteobacteria bacterium]